MKKIVTCIMALAIFVVSASAQETKKMKHYKHHKHHQHGMMMKALNLTPDQQQQMKTSREDFKKQMAALNKNESITVKESRDRRAALVQQQKEKMMGILTPDQKTKLETLKKEQQAKHETAAANRMQKMKAKLNLTDDQFARLTDARKSAKDQMIAIRENTSLSREQKKEQLMALKSQAKDNFKSILTTDQLNKMEELKKMRTEKKEAK